jgi:hypothetical protein
MVSLVSFLDENARRDPDHLACTGGGISGYDHAVCTIHVLTAS